MKSCNIYPCVSGLVHLHNISRSIHIVAHVKLHSFWLSNIPLYVHITFCLLNHLFMDSGDASSFWLLCIMLLWTLVYKHLSPAFNSLGYTPRSETAGSSGGSLIHLSREGQSVFHSSCSSSHCHLHGIKVAIFSPSHHHLLFSHFVKIIVILVGVKWFWFAYS